ncbi:MAG: tetratricopeptide repeat protein, partial [Methyloprofundus sp.]|nr:tetratricopeptide repeat protein [Methyloprofundus sp.]
GQGAPEFLRTHPVTVSRIADTRGRAAKHPYRHYPDSLSYQLIKTKLRVYQSNDLNNTYKSFQILQQQGTPEQRAVARYGAGLIDLNLQHFDTARKTFNRLIKLYPNQPQFIMARAQTAYEAKNYAKALTLFKNASKLFPSNKPIKIEYLTTLLKTSHPKTAKDLLLPMLYEGKRTPYIYKLLAQAYGDLNKNAQSHRYLAEYYYAIGQIRDAITQTKLALKANDLNFYLSAILDQRLNFFILEEKASKLNL